MHLSEISGISECFIHLNQLLRIRRQGDKLKYLLIKIILIGFFGIAHHHAKADLAGKIFRAISGNENSERRSIDDLIAEKEGRSPNMDTREFRIFKYREAGITQNFHGSLEANLSGYMFQDNKPEKITMQFFQTPGEPVNFNGERHLMIKSYTQWLHRQGKESSTGISIIKNNSIVEIRNVEEKTITKYEWIGVPATMKLGTEAVVGSVKEQDEKGKILASGKIIFSLEKSGSGVEFCQIEMLLEGPKPTERIERECRVFDSNGKIKKIGVINSVDGAVQLVLEGSVKSGNLTKPPHVRN